MRLAASQGGKKSSLPSPLGREFEEGGPLISKQSFQKTLVGKVPKGASEAGRKKEIGQRGMKALSFK